MCAYGSIPTFGGHIRKNTDIKSVFFLIVLSVGIEPTSQLPQSCVLSIERREGVLKAEAFGNLDAKGFAHCDLCDTSGNECCSYGLCGDAL